MKHISEFLPTIDEIAAGRLMTREEFNASNMEAFEERVAICMEAGISQGTALMTAQTEFNERLKKYLENPLTGDTHA